MKNKILNIFMPLIILLGTNLAYINGADNSSDASATKETLNNIISIVKTSMQIPKTFDSLKTEFSKIIDDEAGCLINPSSGNCPKLCKGERKACAGLFLESASNIMQSAKDTILGKMNGTQYTQGIATGIISVLTEAAQKVANLSFVKNKFKDNKIVNKIQELIGKMKTVILPKFGTITGYLETALDLIKALAISLNPEQAIKNAPTIELPTIDLSGSETGEDDSFTIEE